MDANVLFDLTGRVAIVTGGNGGIGKGMALGLAGAGTSIVVAARNPQKNAHAVKEIEALGVKVRAIPVDVTSEEEVGSLIVESIETFGRIDILINNAGTNVRKRPEEYSVEQWDFILNTNLRSAFLCSRAGYPHMKKAGGGKIINIGSMFSIFGGNLVSVYSASKGGIVQFTRSLAVAWAPDNIQVNAILPGWIKTDLTAPMPQLFPEWYRTASDRIPAGRWGEPIDLAGTAMFLASRASDYVTGVALPVDGGYSVK